MNVPILDLMKFWINFAVYFINSDHDFLLLGYTGFYLLSRVSAIFTHLCRCFLFFLGLCFAVFSYFGHEYIKHLDFLLSPLLLQMPDLPLYCCNFRNILHRLSIIYLPIIINFQNDWMLLFLLLIWLVDTHQLKLTSKTHRYKAKQENNRCLYQSIKKVVGWDCYTKKVQQVLIGNSNYLTSLGGYH
jgi:hypothetical protein